MLIRIIELKSFCELTFLSLCSAGEMCSRKPMSTYLVAFITSFEGVALCTGSDQDGINFCQ